MVSPSVYLHPATLWSPLEPSYSPVPTMFVTVVIRVAPAWRPMPLSALPLGSALTGGRLQVDCVVRRSVMRFYVLVVQWLMVGTAALKQNGSGFDSQQ